MVLNSKIVWENLFWLSEIRSRSLENPLSVFDYFFGLPLKALRPCQTSFIEIFFRRKLMACLKTVNYSCKKFHNTWLLLFKYFSENVKYGTLRLSSIVVLLFFRQRGLWFTWISCKVVFTDGYHTNI